MAQRQHSKPKQKKSDFPIFDYIDMVMPDKLVSRFMDLPRHVRWTIVSSLASLVILWIVLRFVVGGLYAWIDGQGPFLKDSFYLPYNFSERPLPVSPEGTTAGEQFLVLPDQIGDQYVLQIPPSEDQLLAAHQAEVDAFLALAQPAADALTALRQSLSPQPDASAPATSADTTVATAVPDAQAVPTVVPTVDPVQLQVMALDSVLTPLTTLNATLQDANSIQAAQNAAFELQTGLNNLEGSGISLPPEIEPFKQGIEELAALPAPVWYTNNECLMAALPREDKPDEPLPCGITQRATFVEQGTYVKNDGTVFNVAVAEFPRPVDAAWAIKQLFYRARAIGLNGNFALDNIIEYNYFFSQIDGVYTLAWTHDGWVYSISGPSVDTLDALVKVFPY